MFMPHWPKPLGSKPIDFGLERTLKLLEILGDPHEKIAPVIHVAGTNGKGSTIAFMKAIFEAAGYKVNAYTSPHLLDFNERILLSGKQISDDLLTELADECRIAAGDMRITFFEGTTVLAFLAFARNDADITLLETGMGGRLDATNVLSNTACTILTPISLDHMEYLGPDISTIAREKVEIMRKGVPCISSMQFDDANAIIEQKADELGSPLFCFDYDFSIEKIADGFNYLSKRGNIKLPKPSLFGDHQMVNAATAITAIKSLEDYNITDDHIIKGLQNTKWLARMQKLQKGKLIDMLPDGWEVWLDGAHNSAGTHVLSCVIDDFKDKPTYIICGFTRGRDVKQLLSPLKGKVDFVCSVLVETEIAALKAEDIADSAKEIGFNAQGFESIDDCFEFLKKLDSKPARIIFCGSLYLASDTLKLNSGL